MNGPIESKVKAATGGSAAGVALAGAILWLLDTYAFKADPVPDVIVALVWALIPVGLTFLGGFSARHTFRSDKDALAARKIARVDEEAKLHRKVVRREHDD